MIQYLLGTLPDEEKVSLEEEFFRDDASYEQLLALEDELMYDYLQNELSQEDRERFTARFLSSPRDQKQLEFAQRLLESLSPEHQLTPASEPVAGGARIFPFFRLFRPSQWALAAAAIVLLLLSVWLIFEANQLRNQVRRLEAESRETQRQLAEAQRVPDAPRSIPPPAATKPPTFLSLALTPGLTRSSGELRQLVLTKEVNRVRLQLYLKTDEYPSYRAEIRTVEGIEIWTQEGLRVGPADTGKAVVLELPAKILADGDYEIALQGLSPSGVLEEVADYYFRVTVSQ